MHIVYSSEGKDAAFLCGQNPVYAGELCHSECNEESQESRFFIAFRMTGLA
jgi:hypothetical protein